MDNFFLLLELAKKGALTKKIFTSTLSISSNTGISQQSVSRKIRELFLQGFIDVSSSPKGITVVVTQNGKKELLLVFGDLENVFSKKKDKSFKGTVESGLGEGKYYLSFPQYQKQIEQKLGFVPYAGTLNLRTNNHDLDLFKQGAQENIIDGFSTKERTFGGLKAYKIKINDTITGGLVFPDRSNNPREIAEIIAPIFLRKKMNLKDGATLKITSEEI